MTYSGLTDISLPLHWFAFLERTVSYSAMSIDTIPFNEFLYYLSTTIVNLVLSWHSRKDYYDAMTA